MSTSILFVAASPSDEGQVEAAFARAGYSLARCESFSTGRRALQEKGHVLAIIDSDLPDGAGIDLLLSAAGAPTVVLSERIEVPDRLSFLRAGAADCLGKPCDPLHLVARAVSVLNRQKGLPPVAAPGFARRLLVVDDSATYAHALGDELRHDGHDVAVALSGHDALSYFLVQELDLAVVDAFLPDLHAVDLVKRMRGAPQRRRAPVLILTGRERSALRDRALDVDATVLPKSRDLEAVRMQVRRMLASEEFGAASSRRSVAPPSFRDAGQVGGHPQTLCLLRNGVQPRCAVSRGRGRTADCGVEVERSAARLGPSRAHVAGHVEHRTDHPGGASWGRAP